METVSFTRMAAERPRTTSSLARREEEYTAALPDRLLDAVRALEHSFAGYQVSRLEHSLQSATRAPRDGRSDEYVVAACSTTSATSWPLTRTARWWPRYCVPTSSSGSAGSSSTTGSSSSTITAARPGRIPTPASAIAATSRFDDTAEFCERYDQNCFDPAYDSLPVEAFEPLVRAVFSVPRYLSALGASASAAAARPVRTAPSM